MRRDYAQYLANFKGILVWEAYNEGWKNTSRPKLIVELFIKDHLLPIRQPKATEISTIRVIDPASRVNLSTNMIFFGTPEPLSITISGWVITPTLSNKWNPKDASGNALNWGSISYGEIVSYMLEGRLNRSATGVWQRKDPDYYVTPYGHKYNQPIIANWDPSYTPVRKKQDFSAQLYLER